MSSTNRSNARDIHISDYYVTPSKPILDLFEALKESECCDLFTADDGKLHWWLFSFCFSFTELQLETVSKAFHITFQRL